MLMESVNKVACQRFVNHFFLLGEQVSREELLPFIFRWSNPRGHSEFPVFLLSLLDFRTDRFSHVHLLGTQTLRFKGKERM